MTLSILHLCGWKYRRFCSSLQIFLQILQFVRVAFAEKKKKVVWKGTRIQTDSVPRKENRLNYLPSSPPLSCFPPTTMSTTSPSGDGFFQVLFKLRRRNQSSLIKVSRRFYISFCHWVIKKKQNKTHSAQSKSNQSHSFIKHSINRKKICSLCPERMDAKNRVIFWLCLRYL